MKQIVYLTPNEHSKIASKLADCIFRVTNGAISFFVCSEIPKKLSSSTVLIVSKEMQSITLVNPNVPILISSDISGISDCLMKQHAQIVYSCGFGEHDCISFSSVLSAQRMISLNRTVKTLDGQLIDPFEMPISFEVKHPFFILSCVLALLLCDISPETIFQKLSFDNPCHSSHTMFANTTKQIEE